MGHHIDILATYLYFSRTVTVPLTGTAFLTPHLIVYVSLDQTQLMDTKINHCEALHSLGQGDLNKVIGL